MLKELVYTLFIAGAAILANIYLLPLDKTSSSAGEPIEIQSVFGRLRGQTGVTRGGRTIYKFTSIPYAISPVDNLRFEPPLKFGKWEGTLDATKTAPACAQFDVLMGKSEGQEDCLFLNVYTPTTLPPSSEIGSRRKKMKLLPVMVFIHGGHFMYGSHRFYTPDYILDEDVILVTFNYRLNSLGFLNTGDSVVTGNQGMKDQVCVLKWIQEAIVDFGGNPDLVTLFGNSAGGASVGFHMLSNMSKGLFHRAISQSGSSLSPIIFTRNPTKQAIRLGNKLGCSTANSQEIVACLKRLRVEDIIRVHEETYDAFYETDAIFTPSVEKPSVDQKNKEDIFLWDSPSKLLQEGKFHKVPMIAGVTQDEGCFRTPLVINDQRKLDLMTHNWTSVIIENLNLHSAANPEATAGKIREEYFPEEEDAVSLPPRGDPMMMSLAGRQITKEDIKNLSNIFGDRFFAEPCSQEGLYHSRHAPLYLYYFTKKSDIGYGYILEWTRGGLLPVNLGLVVAYLKALLHLKLGWTVDNYGVCHTDELPFLFKLSFELDVSRTSPNFGFSESLIKLWASFARNGKPDSFQGVEWVKADQAGGNSDETWRYLEIGDTPKMISEPFASRVRFWKSLSLSQN